LWIGLTLVLMPTLAGVAGEPLTLADGDRVVLVGSTLIEREQRSGYWETALTRRFPGRKIQIRNLGWSGDTVFGHARAGFGSTADGFRHLRDHVLALKPTVVLLGYGTNESFDGPIGLPRFQEGCKTLLAVLAPTRARILWLSPLRQEKMPPPLPDPVEQNRNLGLYRDAIAEIARSHGHGFVDLFTPLSRDNGPPRTDNGIHLTAQGYWESARVLEQGLGLKDIPFRVTLKADGGVGEVQGTTVQQAPGLKRGWVLTDDVLPFPPAPEKGTSLPSALQRVITIEGLAPGKYTLTIDGEPVATAEAGEWARGVSLTRGKELDQVERLRQAIIAKDLLYFHRWRPQNETYLFGFRKHEQGQNAREIPQFDPLVEKAEEEIAQLTRPQKHTYEIKPGAN
jgi:lysophospholipase L1-like esterase